MTERRRYTKRQKATAVIAAELSTVAAAAEQTGVPESSLRYWLDDPQFADLRAKTREDMAEGFGVLVHLAAERLRVLVPTMEARDLVTLLGVATDKAQLLSGHATARTESRSVIEHLNPETRDALADEVDAWLRERSKA